MKKFLEEKVMPAMGKISSNKVIKSITAGMMSTMPLSLGTSIIAIIANFPVEAWTNFLASTGIQAHMSAAISGTTEIIGVYIAFIVAYNYAKELESDSMTAGVLSLAAYFILMPHSFTTAEGSLVTAFQKTYLGSSGVFVALLCGILISKLYSVLKKRGMYLRLPDSVPEMVSKSLSPTFIAMTIFIIIVAIRIAFGFTSYGNAFDFINQIIGKPIMALGTSAWSLIIIYGLSNLLWCFGIHPSAPTSVLVPVFLTAFTANIQSFQSGEVLPYLTFVIAYKYVMLGGTGNTIGLAIDMALFSKSERYKTLGKLSIIPNIFNINEPLIFGTPIIYNPIFILPMTLSAIISGIMAVLFVNFGFYNGYNPTVRMPWTMPAPIIHLFESGVMPFVCVLVTILVMCLLYLPFFKYADSLALKEEEENKA